MIDTGNLKDLIKHPRLWSSFFFYDHYQKLGWTDEQAGKWLKALIAAGVTQMKSGYEDIDTMIADSERRIKKAIERAQECKTRKLSSNQQPQPAAPPTPQPTLFTPPPALANLKPQNRRECVEYAAGQGIAQAVVEDWWSLNEGNGWQKLRVSWQHALAGFAAKYKPCAEHQSPAQPEPQAEGEYNPYV